MCNRSAPSGASLQPAPGRSTVALQHHHGEGRLWQMNRSRSAIGYDAWNHRSRCSLATWPMHAHLNGCSTPSGSTSSCLRSCCFPAPVADMKSRRCYSGLRRRCAPISTSLSRFEKQTATLWQGGENGWQQGRIGRRRAFRSGTLTCTREPQPIDKLADHAATCSAWVAALPARAGVVRISQSAVTVAPLTFANAITPSQCSAGIRFRAAHARTFTGSVSTVGAAATLAAPPSDEISEA